MVGAQWDVPTIFLAGRRIGVDRGRGERADRPASASRRSRCARGRSNCFLSALDVDGTLVSKLQLSVAIGDYDRMRPLVDGLVQIDGVDPQFMLLEPEEIFFRAFRHADFDICELSLSSYSIKIAAGTSPYIAVPVFPSRAFRHTSIYVRTDRIKSPADLKGCSIGVPGISAHGEYLGPHDPRRGLRNPSG